MNVADYLEEHLGRIQQGYRSAELPALQVVRFADVPGPGLVTLATLGLSDHVLSQASGRAVRQEFLFVTHHEQFTDRLALMLLHVGDVVHGTHRALARGEVFDVGGRVDPSGVATAVYASVPVVFGDEFGECDATDPPTVMVWLFPVLPEEVEMIRTAGWSAFEDALEAGDPDLFDLMRKAITT